jgi:protein SCO1/2
MLKIKLLLTTTLLSFSCLSFSATSDMPVLSGVGGDFSAVDTNGENIKFSSYKGKVILLSFGYTNCADICPFTLGYLKHIYAKLTPAEQQKVRIIFVTIDPEYDTPKHLKAFIGHFNKDFIGLSGTKEQTNNIVSLYQAEYRKLADVNVPTEYIRRINSKEEKNSEAQKQDKGSLFSHTVAIYLIDKEGETRSLEYTGTHATLFANKIRELINE